MSVKYISRNLNGQIEEMILPDLKGVKYGYDKCERLSWIQSSDYTANLTYNSLGDLVLCQSIDGEGPKAWEYEYDHLHQLIKENEHHYRYDSLSNRLLKDGNSYEVNNLNQLKSDGRRRYEYDLNGNLISDSESVFTYDSQDRLVRIERDGLTIDYVYDPFHRRLSLSVNGLEEKFLWDGENEIGKIVGNKVVELRILGEGLGAEIGASVLMEIGDKSYIPIHDYRGCLISLKELNGTYRETARYDAYGMREDKRYLCPWGFCGKRVEVETGYVYFGRRYYDPQTGRWVTPDPLGFRDGPNLYAYVHNSPLTHLDLYGLAAQVSNDTRRRRAHSYNSFEDHFSEKSRNYHLLRPNLKNGAVGFINGMRNSFGEAFKKCSLLSDMLGGYNVEGTYNAKCDFASSILSGALNLAGMRLPVTESLLRKWNYFFDHAPQGVPYLEFGHSLGTGSIRNALPMLPPERRERMHIVAVCPSVYIPKELCGYIMHYVSESDIVPGFDVIGRKQARENTKILKRDSRADTFLDHDFCSPTFRPEIQNEIDRFKDILKKYEN